MTYPGSPLSRLKYRFQLLMDMIERSAPRVDTFGMWAGGIIGSIGAAMTVEHEWYPTRSFTEVLITFLGDLIRIVHSWLPWSVADTATYFGFGLFLLSLIVRIVRRLNRIGST
jgi:hypothetical protein